eukprot:8586690-Ditylum_brightwellii.AAC.1
MMNIEEAAANGYMFIISVDDAHCPIEEPSSWSSQWASHKISMNDGVNYEIGHFISESKLA